MGVKYLAPKHNKPTTITISLQQFPQVTCPIIEKSTNHNARTLISEPNLIKKDYMQIKTFSHTWHGFCKPRISARKSRFWFQIHVRGSNGSSQGTYGALHLSSYFRKLMSM